MASRIESLTAEVNKLEQRLEREREARAQSETIAENGLRELYARQQEIRLLQSVAVAANEADTVESVLQEAVNQVCTFMSCPLGHAYLVDQFGDSGFDLEPSAIWSCADSSAFGSFRLATSQKKIHAGSDLPGRVLTDGRPTWIPDISSDTNFQRKDAAVECGLRSAFAFPVCIGREVVAVLEFFCDQVRMPDAYALELMAHIGTQLGRVIERRRAQHNFDRQIERLAALRSIDVAILSSMDLNLTLGIVIDQILAQLGVDAACILQYNRHTHGLLEIAGKGFRDKTRTDVERRIDQCSAGHAAIQRRPFFIADIRRNPELHEATSRKENEGFVSYLAVPLVAKGQVKGVLELFRRAPFRATHEVLEFVEALAGQAAIAIDNATLFSNLQRSNIELSLAYDATIEGWARALELRDKETEGHTQRVTELTLVLAQSMDIRGEDLVHIRWGALLHDIGKVGIPDQILHKPGPLTPEERTNMQLHPVLAYEMLWPIEFLRPAIDIPYYHHEKWDGTGYPCGLRGEQIPLSARIFAAVDVWDALRNERPYKPAWPAAKALDLIRSEAGKHFDPRVVELFVQVIGAQTGKVLPSLVRLAA